MIARYVPERVSDLTEMNRVSATLKEIGVKVAAAIRSLPYPSEIQNISVALASAHKKAPEGGRG